MTFKATKDPDSVIDYQIDWAAVLNATSPVDTISTSTWYPTHGLTVDSDSNTTTKTTVMLSGGQVGKVAMLVNRITTAGGRTHDRTIEVTIRHL